MNAALVAIGVGCLALGVVSAVMEYKKVQAIRMFNAQFAEAMGVELKSNETINRKGQVTIIDAMK